jgi:hypothetical protein
MKNPRCRLCLADIPHDYDHSLEVEFEKEHCEEFEEVAFDLIPPDTKRPSDSWPDASATVSVIFTVLVANLSLLYLFLILWASYLHNTEGTSADGQWNNWLVAVYCCAGGSLVVNSVMAYVLEKKLKSRVILFTVVFAVVFWGGAVIWTRRNSL